MYLKESSKHLIMTQTRRWSIYTSIPVLKKILTWRTTFWNTNPGFSPSGTASFSMNGFITCRNQRHKHPKQHPEIHPPFFCQIRPFCFPKSSQWGLAKTTSQMLYTDRKSFPWKSPNGWKHRNTHRNISVLSIHCNRTHIQLFFSE